LEGEGQNNYWVGEKGGDPINYVWAGKNFFVGENGGGQFLSTIRKKG